ncbi:MAG: hypothetical protein ACI4KF_12085 [Huintestinicola sp.]
MSGKVIAYGCVVSGFRSTKSAEKISETEAEWRLHTKVADEIKKLRNLFVAEDIIKIDVIDITRRHRKHLENALKTMGHGDTIIIASLNALGTNNDEVVKNFKRIYKAHIGLLLPDYANANGLSIFATTDYGFSPINISEEEFNKLCDMLSFQIIGTNKGRKKLDVSDEFKSIYWAYEMYRIDPSTACKNKFFTISKNTFRRLCECYENSEEYNSDLEQQELLYKVSGLPKRYGIITDDIANVIRDVAQAGIPFSDACFVYDIQLNEIQFHRYLLKYYIPKSKLMHATSQLRDFEFIESLQPTYDKTS